jgi:hypothetical protein
MKLPVAFTKPFGALKNEQAAFTITVPLVGLETEHVAPLTTSPGRNCEPDMLTVVPVGPLATCPSLTKPPVAPESWMNAPEVTLKTASAKAPLGLVVARTMYWPWLTLPTMKLPVTLLNPAKMPEPAKTEHAAVPVAMNEEVDVVDMEHVVSERGKNAPVIVTVEPTGPLATCPTLSTSES